MSVLEIPESAFFKKPMAKELAAERILRRFFADDAFRKKK